SCAVGEHRACARPGRRLPPLRRLRGGPARQTVPRLSEERQKGRLLPRETGRLLHRLRQIPDQTAALRPETGSESRAAVRQQDHLEHPGTAQGDLVRKGQTGRLIRLQREGLAAPATVIGFDTATVDTAVAAARGDEVLYESLLGLSEKG